MDVRMPDGTIISNVPDDITQTDLLNRYQLYTKTLNEDTAPGLSGLAQQKAQPSADSLYDFPKQIFGSALSGILGAPFGAQQAIKGGARANVENIMPSSVYNPNIDTEEDIFGPETEKQKAQRKLMTERALESVPTIPGTKELNDLGIKVQKTVADSLSDKAKKELADSQITGNILKGELSLGKNPTVRGFALQAASVFGSMVPVITTAIAFKSPTMGGLTGGAMAADEAANTAVDYIGKLDDAQLLKTSPFYAELIRGGADPKEARDLTIAKASESGAILQGLVATFGDRFTGNLVTGAFDSIIKKAAGKSILKNVGVKGAVGSTEEGLQELTEGLASDIGIASVLPNKEIGEDSAANFFLGMLGGAGPGALSGLKRPTEEPTKPSDEVLKAIRQAQAELPPALKPTPAAEVPALIPPPNAPAPVAEEPAVTPPTPEELEAGPSQDREAMLREMGEEAPKEEPKVEAPKVEPKLPPKVEVVNSFPMGENTEYQVLKTPSGYVANLFDKDSGKYVPGSARAFPIKKFGEESETKANEFAQQQAEKAAKVAEPTTPAAPQAPTPPSNVQPPNATVATEPIQVKQVTPKPVPKPKPVAPAENLEEEKIVDAIKNASYKNNTWQGIPSTVDEFIAKNGRKTFDKAVEMGLLDNKIGDGRLFPSNKFVYETANNYYDSNGKKLKEPIAPKATPAEEAVIQTAPNAEPLQTIAPSVQVDAVEKAKAQADLDAALGDLSMILTKGTRLNIMPEDEQKLIPVLTRVMDAAFRMGYYKFKEAAKFVMDYIRSKLGKEAADQISLDHLQGAYIGMAGKYADKGVSSKKDVISVETLNDLEESSALSINTPDGQFKIAQDIAKYFVDGKGFANINEARAYIGKLTGEPINPGTEQAKQADEAIEVGVVLAARQIIEQGGSKDQIYDKLVDLYKRQPNLAVRSSTSIANQAYSTPAPLAYVASELAGITKDSTVYEPTAGNGMLVIGATEKNITANELNPGRHAMLERILPDAYVENINASESIPVNAKSMDAVIANPPFGTVKNKDGEVINFPATSFMDFSTKEIDHAISMRALNAMKEEGRAVLILGGVLAKSEEARREAYRGKAKREFYSNLYGKYNVVDHFTVDGSLYAKQGASYPVDVIVIEGLRIDARPSRELPAADLPKIYTSYEQLKEKLNERPVVSRGNERPTGTNIVPSTEGENKPEGVGGGAGRPSGEPSTEGRKPTEVSKPSVPENEPSAGGQREPTGAGAGTEQPGPANKPERVTTEGPVPSTGEAKPSGGKGNERNEPSGLGGVSVVSGERVGSGLKNRAGEEQETATQVSYTPQSKANAVGTLMPKAMAESIENSLARLEEQFGDIDDFVADKLEMDPETLRINFSAEQIDAIALAIKNAEEGKGFIIGDQTGVGKGRVVAAMIKYALINDKVPIFVTEKPNLYSDMIRDLDDIGMTNQLGLDTAKPKILITNSSETIPYTLLRNVNGEITENNLNLKAPKTGAALDGILKGMIDKDNLGDYKVIFTTYSQLQTVKGKQTERQRFISHFGNGNYMIFDESHNAGGAGETQARSKEQREAAKEGKSLATGRSAFVRSLVQNAFGTFFSSATYAKRPDVMDLYSSTDMKLAVDKIADLADAIKNGGIPMQQTVAKMLTQVGQYIRRERTFAGVSYNTTETKVDKQTAENMATSMRDILAFSRGKEVAVKELQGSLDKMGGVAKIEGEKTQVQSANFGAIMHNLIDQMLLSLKAQDSVRHAIERLKAGEKVVMTVSNTMGSFLQSYADDMNINVGDPVNLSFKDLYIRYLEKQRMVTIKKPGGVKQQYRLTDNDLGPALVEQYKKIYDFIENAGFGSAPISPIDYLHSELRKAGYKTEEITGRTVTLNYESGKPILTSRSANIKQRVNAVKAFNSGAADVIILNQAGSTGLSLHASSKVKDQRKRHMIIVQPEKNIDTHMQMLGRVHRTGQVMPPAYSQMMADIPAEMRPAAVLLKKMASLNANTTASRKSAVSAEGAVDFINDYGGQVVQEYLKDNPDVHEAIGGKRIVELVDDPAEADEADIRRFTGYVPILPIKQQEEVYKDLVERYNDLIEREDSMGTNKLEAKAQDLDAVTISSKPITESKGDQSAFAQPAYMEKVDVKRTIKPFTKAEVEDQIKENLNGKRPKELAKEMWQDVSERGNTYIQERLKAVAASGADAVKMEETRGQLNLQYNTIKAVLDVYPIGTPVSIKNANGLLISGVITDIENKKKTKNPLAGSDWKMQIALANGDAKTISMNFSQINSTYQLREEEDTNWFNTEQQEWQKIPVIDLFDKGSTSRRENRWMVTGNILAGYAAVNNMGQIISYTKDDGSTAQGILMPRTFDFEKAEKNAPVKLKSLDNVKAFFDRFYDGYVQTPDSILRIQRRGNSYTFITSKSKREGGQYYNDKGLTDFTDDFYSRSGMMHATVYNQADAEKAIQYLLQEHGLVAGNNKNEAREIFSPTQDFKPELQNIDFTNPNENLLSDREETIKRYQVVRQKRSAILRKVGEGKFGLDTQRQLAELDAAAKDLKMDIDLSKPERREPKNFFTDATKAWDAGLISDDVYSAISTIYHKFPALLKDLKFSVAKGTNGAAGSFTNLARLVRLYKGSVGVENPTTIRHEIVHSLEQMMDEDAAKLVVDNWVDALSAAMKKEKTEKGNKFFDALMAYYDNPSKESYDAAMALLPSYEYYQYMNPSEYWAVNAEKLLASKLGTGWDRFKSSVKKLYEALKYMFGFNNQYHVHKVFDDIMSAQPQRFTKTMLIDYVASNGIEIQNINTRRNYKGGPAPLPTWDSGDDSKFEDDKWIYRLVDKNVDTKRVIQTINKAIGDISDKWDAYLKETLYHGRTAEQSESYLKNELRPLLQKLSDMGVSIDAFEQYLHNRHAKEYNELIAARNPQMPDGGSGIFTQDALDYLNGLDPKKKKAFEILAKDLDDIIKVTQEKLIEGGLETKETIQAWREKMPFYVPLNRNPDELDFVNPGSGLGQGFGTRGAFTKKATGSLKSVVDILANVSLQRERAIVRAEKARVGRALYGLAIMAPNTNFWLAINPDAIRSKKKLEAELINMGLTPDDAENIIQEPKVPGIDPKTGLVKYRVNPGMRNAPNVFPVRIDGKDRFIVFNPGDPRAKRMVEALKNLDAHQLSEGLGTIAEATRLIAAMNTQYNPVFGAWNFARDLGSAAINLESTAIAGKQADVFSLLSPTKGIPALRAIYNVLRDQPASSKEQQKLMDLFRQFTKAGGQTGYREQFSRSNEKANIIEREMSKLDRSNWRKTADAMLDWLSDYNDAMENAVRLSAFKVALDEGLTEERAAELAKNLTVNFNRKGQWTANANALYAFFNASVQGTARMAELMFKKDSKGNITLSPAGKKIIAGGMLLGVTQAVILAMAGFDDDEPPEFLKNKNFIIPIGGKKYLIFPMPLGLNVFPNIARLVTEYGLSGGKHLDKKLASIAGVILDAFNPLGSSGFAQNIAPTVLDPFVGVFVTNKDAFGRPISKEDRANNPTPGYERSRETASGFSKGLAYGLNYITGGGKYGIGAVSPTGDQIDYLIQQYTGGVGRELGKLAETAKAPFSNEPLPSYRVPILGKLYGEAGSPVAVQDKFFKNVTALAEYENQIKRMLKDKESVAEFRKEHPETKLISRANALENQLSEINKRRKAMIERGAPQSVIDKQNETKTRLMTQFNQEMSKLSAQ